MRRTAALNSRRTRPRDEVVWGALGVVVAIGVWQAVASLHLAPASEVAGPVAVVRNLGSLAGTSKFWSTVLHTVQGWLYGLGIAVIIGVPFGMLLGVNEYAWRAFRPTVEFLRPVPSIALIPVAILLYGTSIRSTILLTVFGCVFIIVIQTIYGVQQLDPVARDTARSFRLTLGVRVRLILLPNTLPFLATGLRIASATALIVTITTELIVGAPGLGFAAWQAQNAGRATLLYSYIVAIGVLGLLIAFAFSGLERRVLRWHTSQRVAVEP